MRRLLRHGFASKRIERRMTIMIFSSDIARLVEQGLAAARDLLRATRIDSCADLSRRGPMFPAPRPEPLLCRTRRVSPTRAAQRDRQSWA